MHPSASPDPGTCPKIEICPLPDRISGLDADTVPCMEEGWGLRKDHSASRLSFQAGAVSRSVRDLFTLLLIQFQQVRTQNHPEVTGSSRIESGTPISFFNSRFLLLCPF